MNRKGQISETAAIVLIVITIVLGVMIWMNANNSGPFYWLRTLTPNFDKPAVTEIALSGLIKYDVSANPALQYYDGVKFQNFDSKNGEQVLVVGDKAFKYGKVSDAFNGYYLGGSRKSDSGIRLTGTDASDLVNDLDIANKPGEVSVVATGICDANCVSAVRASSLGILSTINPGDVKIGAYGKQYELYVLINSKKIVYSFGPTNMDNKGQEIGSGKGYADKIWAYASSWAGSVIGGPIALNVYDYKNGVITDSCRSYSFPVSKVKALQGNGFVLTADLSKGTGSGACV